MRCTACCTSASIALALRVSDIIRSRSEVTLPVSASSSERGSFQDSSRKSRSSWSICSRSWVISASSCERTAARRSPESASTIIGSFSAGVCQGSFGGECSRVPVCPGARARRRAAPWSYDRAPHMTLGGGPAVFEPVDQRPDFPALEQRVLDRWRQRDVFARSLQARAGGPMFSCFEGPPTANGRPGVHHVEARAFKDAFPRYRTMKGYRVPRKAGWDCHGIPVELGIERELGFTRKSDIEDYGVAAFNARCRESVTRYVDEWRRLTERIGYWVDLDDAYWTMSDAYVESVWWSLAKLWDQGMIYEGHRVVPYCPRCGTALSDHEVAQGYAEAVDPSVYVRLPVVEGELAFAGGPHQH